jgi:cadherin-like protein
MKKKSIEQSSEIAPLAAKPLVTATALPTAKPLVTATPLPTATEDKALTIKASTLGNVQSVSLVTNGHAKVTLNKTTGNITFTPDADFSGIANFQYTLADGTVHIANIDVAPVADAPKLSVSLENGVGAATKQGTEFLVNTTKQGGQFMSSVATAPDGSFVMAWTDTSYTGDNFAQVRAQRFNADGTKNGSEFRVNTTTGSAQEKPNVAILANGDFAISWSDEGQDSGVPSVKARVFHADGTAVGGAFLVNTTPHAQDASITALSGGGFVVSWEDDSVANDSNIKARVFQADGTPAGSEFVVNTITSRDQDLVSLAALKGGGFVATWQDNSGLNNDGTRVGSIKAQMFNADGSKNGSELLVDSLNVNWINGVPNVTGLSNGGFAVTWDASSNVGDTSGSSVQLQLFHLDGTGKPVKTGNGSAGPQGCGTQQPFPGRRMAGWERPERRRQRLLDQGAGRGCEWQPGRRRVSNQHKYGRRPTISLDRRASQWQLHRQLDRRERLGRRWQ